MTGETVRRATAHETGEPTPARQDPGPATTGPAPGTAPRTTMTDTVVAQIAGIAAAGVPGVHRLGGPLQRAAGERPERGVSVDVREREADVTVELTVEQGVSVAAVAASVRQEVSTAVERMTDLRVRAVDVHVRDVGTTDPS